MVSFARARTRTWLSKLWHLNAQTNNEVRDDLDKSNEFIDNISDKNKYFFEAIKNGGIWFC